MKSSGLEENNMETINQHFRLIRDQNIIVCKISDHWTIEWAEEFTSKIREIVSGFNGQPWCRIVNMHMFQLATPEVIARMHDFGIWSLRNNCLEHVFLFSNSDQEAQVRQAYDGIFEIKTFDFEMDAIRYCQKKLRSQFLLKRHEALKFAHS